MKIDRVRIERGVVNATEITDVVVFMELFSVLVTVPGQGRGDLLFGKIRFYLGVGLLWDHLDLTLDLLTLDLLA